MKNICLMTALLCCFCADTVLGQSDIGARDQFIQEVFGKAETADTKERSFLELLRKWPREHIDDNQQLTYDYAIAGLARALAEEGRGDDAVKYLKQMRERFWRAQGYSPVADILLRQGD